MSDSAFTAAGVLSSIQAVLQNHLAVDQGLSLPPHPPSFDPRVRSPLKTRSQEIAFQLSSLDLPSELNNEVTSLLAAETANYQSFVEQMRQRLLGDLSTTTVSSNPSALPSLVDAACQAFYNLTVDSGLDSVRKQLSGFADQDGSPESGDESDSSYDTEEEDQEEEGLELPEGDDDENLPIKPGEEVPPLETKYLPIFEALHERGKVLTKPEKTYLVNMTGMTYRQITIWFQNRRRGELKEEAQTRPSGSRASSVDSFSSSAFSENEPNLEQRILNDRSDTTFDIRSWRLTSALPTKVGPHGSSFPPSPTKLSFGASVMASDSDTDDTLSDDSDDETDAPPGLWVPSLTTSMSTLDSATTASGSSQVNSSAIARPLVTDKVNGSDADQLAFSRPIRSLPSSRRNTPPSPSQSVPMPQAPVFDFNFATSTSTTAQAHPSATPHLPSRAVTSNEHGLVVQMDTTPPSITTLRSSPSSGPHVGALSTPTPPNASVSPPAIHAGSPPHRSSPTPSGHSGSSPRPPLKPLPRRTGCAPRPRPPPRAGSTSTPASANPAGSTRSSVVLPPSSNPSLVTTTLGTLLRPNPPAPVIPAEMEDRLTAMAGRMGVGAGPLIDSDRRRAPINTPLQGRAGAISTGITLPPRGVSFSFAPAPLPKPSTSSRSTSQSTSQQSTQAPTAPSSQP